MLNSFARPSKIRPNGVRSSSSLRSSHIRRPVQGLVPLLLLIPLASGAQSSTSQLPGPVLPDAPQPQSHTPAPHTGPCELRNAGAAVASAASIRALEVAGLATQDDAPLPIKPAPCPAYLPVIDWYSRFVNGPQVKPLTPKEKAWLAVRNVADPFNILTILGDSGIAVASNSHSAYGPGMPGFARNVGVSFSQDVTSEFFGTFVIPSLAHEDPHYHRMPEASIPRRAIHSIVQIAWTQGDNGRPMINYSSLIGTAINIEIGNLYVPGQQTDLPSSAARYGISLGLAPEDNLITEFLPDVARHIHVQVVFVQRIINRVAATADSPNP